VNDSRLRQSRFKHWICCRKQTTLEQHNETGQHDLTLGFAGKIANGADPGMF
jgi:hypothetical protein